MPNVIRTAALRRRLVALAAARTPLEGAGVSVCCRSGWLSGNGALFSADYDLAFAFASRTRASEVILDFADLFDKPRVFDRPADPSGPSLLDKVLAEGFGSE